ncbi:MAG: hypothetical protein ACYTDT_08635 [Planctomycetota bacterium]
MGKKNSGEKKGNGKTVAIFLLLVVVGGFIAGYVNRELPIVGPTVTWIMGKASSGLDKTGEYEISIENLTINHEEFKKGESVELRVIVIQLNSEGDEILEWDSDDFGEVDREAGKDSMTADWKHTPIKKILWRDGDQFIVTILDGGEDLCVWKTDPKAKEFPLNSEHMFDRVRGQKMRMGGVNSITFSAKRVGDLPTPKK